MMPVYVDDMYLNPIGEFRGMKMSHLIADTREELLQMVDKINVQRQWIQKMGTPSEHFDICMSKRVKAIQFGAIPISYRELGEMVRRRMLTGELRSTK